MFLPQTVEYALRAMAQLATLPLDQPVRSADLARMAGIPESYLSKIMRRLVATGLLSSEKGHGGGFKLRLPLAEVRFIDILSALDVDLESRRCAFGLGDCDADDPCLLHPAMVQLREAQLTWAKNTTLATLTAPKAKRPARRR